MCRSLKDIPHDSPPPPKLGKFRPPHTVLGGRVEILSSLQQFNYFLIDWSSAVSFFYLKRLLSWAKCSKTFDPPPPFTHTPWRDLKNCWSEFWTEFLRVKTCLNSISASILIIKNVYQLNKQQECKLFYLLTELILSLSTNSRCSYKNEDLSLKIHHWRSFFFSTPSSLTISSH